MTDQAAVPPTPSAPQRKKRSPSYPGIDLGLALQRARELWEHEHHYAANVETVLGHWGYGAKSGGGYAALAALKSFGLVVDEGSGDSRTASLTRLAQDIITTESEYERGRLTKKAALAPKAHADLWAKYQAQLPSDQTMVLFLIREQGFTPNGASELVSEWKRTMAFANLTANTDTLSPNGDDDPEHGHGPTGGATLTPPAVIDDQQGRQHDLPKPLSKQDFAEARATHTVQVPYGLGKFALLQAEFPMSEAEWQAMMSVLTAMKDSGLAGKAEETD
jgi:hypothetical protein